MRQSRMPKWGQSRRKKPPMQWVCSTTGYAPLTATPLAAGNLTQGELVGSLPRGHFDPPDIDRFTVQRVRGDVNLRLAWDSSSPPSKQAVALSYGIIVQSITGAGSTGAFAPNNTTDGGASWLFLAHRLFAWQQDAAGSGFMDVNIPVDVRVKRVLREGDMLMWSCLWNNVGALAPAVNLFQALRTLISRVA